MTRAAVIALLVALARPAHAEPKDDAAVDDASDANLESTADRRGMTFDVAVGGGLIIGFGIKDSVGRGGSVALSLGHVATRRTVINFNLDVIAALHKLGAMDPVSTNFDIALTAGAKHWLNTSLWVRGAAGLGGYNAHSVALDSGGVGDLSLLGPVLIAGIGIDLARLKWTVVTLDASLSTMINSDGVLAAGALRVGLSFD